MSVSVATMSYSMYEPSSTVTFPVVSAVDNILSQVDELSVVYTVDNGWFNCPAPVVNDGKVGWEAARPRRALLASVPSPGPGALAKPLADC